MKLIPTSFFRSAIAARSSTLSLALSIVAVALSGCATVPADSGNDPRDPLESFNRQVFEFNEVVDRAVLKPVAQAYEFVLPEPVRDCVSNIFSNFREPSNAVNNLLQGKPIDAISDVCRLVVNSTIGLAGCFDPARKMGLEKHSEDFGQTLGRWGLGAGPYLVVPILGPSSVRDAIGIYGAEPYLDPNFYIDNIRVRNAIIGTRVVDQRAQLLRADDLVSGAALDKYRFIRDGYLQRRRSQVYDGSPPPSADDAPLNTPSASPPAADPNVKKELVPPQSNPAPASK
ncbi:MAG TPA: VacJ family lipoprotein [Burkholderiaceae bacterium]|nr:VacJ family lipoprotein [Burkholderiaceae bacterium]